jgi:hypothetical protein
MNIILTGTTRVTCVIVHVSDLCFALPLQMFV